MSSRGLVVNRTDGQWVAVLGISGTAVWSALALLAGLHRVRLGIIELLFLLAPLVIVPLGLELADSLAGSNEILDWPVRAGRVVATCAACIAMCIPPGRMAAVLASVWLLHCGVLAYARLGIRHREHSLRSRIIDLAHVDLLFGAAWLVISRANWRPIGFQEPITLLTAVHFHYSGFATALLAAATLRRFEDRVANGRSVRLLLVAIVLLPFAVAAGFVFSPLLRCIAALALSISLTAVAVVWLRLSDNFHNLHARFFVRFSAFSVVAALSLSSLYAMSEYFGEGWITVPLMANPHGVLNSLGFVLLGLLAWLTEERAAGMSCRERETETMPHWSGRSTLTGERRGPVPVHPSPIPEFVARDFYDR